MLKLVYARCVGYSIEVFEEGYTVWEKLASCIPGLSYTAKELRNNRVYRFRVRAENIYGASPPLDSGKIVAKNPFSKNPSIFNCCLMSYKCFTFVAALTERDRE
jgi:hypothetical protein